ncbi:Protein CBG09803 [Caenorhabditis briggsae]|uniref:Protein CBG09803 n=1 Tax=Caenorhabditis briggsae TaxID=6238 RepID=A8X9N9_CAEBR|nr:Protein CBG09803 [Caenorhabditis briggsae]CAP29354.2 Protein CBG09803 [Caenorhabditis briggsae]
MVTALSSLSFAMITTSPPTPPSAQRLVEKPAAKLPIPNFFLFVSRFQMYSLVAPILGCSAYLLQNSSPTSFYC